jgi:hypothetical protein
MKPARTIIVVTAVLALLGASSLASAQDLSQELRGWLEQTEQKLSVNPLITYSAVAANPQAYSVTTAVRLSGSVIDLVPADDPKYVYAALRSDCGASLSLWTWAHPNLRKAMRLRAVVEAPRAGRNPAAPIMALAWAPETAFSGVEQAPAAPSGDVGTGGRLVNAQPSTDPNVAGGPRTIRGTGGSGTLYGTDTATGLPYYGPPRSSPAATGPEVGVSASARSYYPNSAQTGWVYGSAASEQGQFAAYYNLARYFNRKLSHEQAYRVAQCIFGACANYRVPRPLLAAIIHAESDFNPRDTSHAGAMGLTQLMPETCHDYGITDPYDITQNIYGGAREFSEDLARYRDRDANTQVTLALAAYNAGPGAVKRAGGVPQNGETPPYIRHVLSTYSELVAKGYR